MFLSALVLAAAIAAPRPFLVKDILQTPASYLSSQPANFITAGRYAYFSAFTPAYGTELWRTDGTVFGTRLVKDLDGSHFNSLGPTSVYAVFHDRLLFTTDWNAPGGQRLWTTDGTEEGTKRLDLPGTGLIAGLYVLGDRLLVVRSAGLWDSDGTSEGTRTVSTAAGNAVFIRALFIGPGAAWFFATEGNTQVRGLWRYDGSSVQSVFPVQDSVYDPVAVAPLDPTHALLFVNQRVYRTDGTPGGSPLLLQPDPSLSNPIQEQRVRVVNGIAYFLWQTVNEGVELWRSDGTAAGTFLLRNSDTHGGDSWPSNLTPFGDRLLFAANGSLRRQLWITDGTQAGTQPLQEVGTLLFNQGHEAAPLPVLDGVVYFPAFDSQHGAELWRSDGTTGGTSMVADIAAGAADSVPAMGAVINHTVVFSAADQKVGRELWRTDGTAAGTWLLRDVAAATDSSDPHGLRRLGSSVVFTATDEVGEALWKSDGTSGGTVPLLRGRQVTTLATCGGLVYFDACTTPGCTLWRTDGTPAGTLQLTTPAISDGSAGSGACAGDAFVFGPSFSSATLPIRITRGTAQTTTLLLNSPNGSVYAAGDKAIFFNSDAQHGFEPWITDGTAQGTKLLKDLSGDAQSSFIGKILLGPGNSFFLVASTGVWRSDGTEAGTIKTELSPQLEILAAASAGSTTFFLTRGALWKVEGTTATQVASLGNTVPEIVAYGGKVYFNSYVTPTGEVLWQSDGTAAGTHPVSTLPEGKQPQYPRNLTVAGGLLWFSGDAVTHFSNTELGHELYVTDGTSFSLVQDIYAGSQGSSPAELTPAGPYLFFTASTITQGKELWAVPIGPFAPSPRRRGLK